MHFLEKERRSSALGIRNGENEVNQGMESSFHYPSNKKYVICVYVMRKPKTEFNEYKNDCFEL